MLVGVTSSITCILSILCLSCADLSGIEKINCSEDDETKECIVINSIEDDPDDPKPMGSYYFFR